MIDTEKLIFEVEKRPYLWKFADKNYNNKIKKKAAWDEICEILYAERWKKFSTKEKMESVLAAQRKWKSVRDYYRKSKNEQGRCESPTFKRKKYIFFDNLTFLDVTMEGRNNYDESLIDPPFNVNFLHLHRTQIHETDPLAINVPTTSHVTPAKKPTPSASIVKKLKSYKEISIDPLSNNRKRVNEGLIKKENYQSNIKNNFSRIVQSSSTSRTHQEKYKEIDESTVDGSNEGAAAKSANATSSKSKTNNDNAITKFQEELLSVLSAKYETTKEIDEDVSFLMSVLPSIKKLNDLQKIDFKSEILTILHKMSNPDSLITTDHQPNENLIEDQNQDQDQMDCTTSTTNQKFFVSIKTSPKSGSPNGHSSNSDSEMLTES